MSCLPSSKVHPTIPPWEPSAQFMNSWGTNQTIAPGDVDISQSFLLSPDLRSLSLGAKALHRQAIFLVGILRLWHQHSAQIIAIDWLWISHEKLHSLETSNFNLSYQALCEDLLVVSFNFYTDLYVHSDYKVEKTHTKQQYFIHQLPRSRAQTKLTMPLRSEWSELHFLVCQGLSWPRWLVVGAYLSPSIHLQTRGIWTRTRFHVCPYRVLLAGWWPAGVKPQGGIVPCSKGTGIAWTCGILDSKNRSDFFLLKDRDLLHQNPVSGPSGCW